MLRYSIRFSLLIGVLAASGKLLFAQEPKPIPPQLDDVAISKIVTDAAAALRAGYVYPDKAELAAKLLESELASKTYEQLTEPDKLAEKLTADVRKVTNDLHLNVFGPPSPLPKSQEALAEPPSNDSGFERVDRLSGNVGYIRLERRAERLNRGIPNLLGL